MEIEVEDEALRGEAFVVVGKEGQRMELHSVDESGVLDYKAEI